MRSDSPSASWSFSDWTDREVENDWCWNWMLIYGDGRGRIMVQPNQGPRHVCCCLQHSQTPRFDSDNLMKQVISLCLSVCPSIRPSVRPSMHASWFSRNLRWTKLQRQKSFQRLFISQLFFILIIFPPFSSVICLVLPWKQISSWAPNFPSLVISWAPCACP